MSLLRAHTIHFAVWIDTFSRDPVYILWGARGPAKIRITSRMLEHYGASVSEVADNTEARSQ